MAQKPSNRTARARAAQARAEQQAAEKRRQRTVNIAAGIGVALVFVLIVGGAWWAAQSGGSDPVDNAEPDPAAAAPAGSLPADDDNAFGVVYGGPDDAPVMEIWEDFQCPACAQFETAAGENLRTLADDGKVQLIYRTTTFLDRNLGTDNSLRAASAYGCAVDAGKGNEFHTEVFANQPQTEGEGWTDEQLISFGQNVGIEGTDFDTFEQCVKDRTYTTWAANSTQEFYDAGVPGTPSIYLNGEVVETTVALDPKSLEKAVNDATKQ